MTDFKSKMREALIKLCSDIQGFSINGKVNFTPNDSGNQIINQSFSSLLALIEKRDKEAIKENYDEFLRYYYNAPCSGCPEGHASFHKTIIESPEWKAWSKVAHYDIAECECLGICSEVHWRDFVKFITQAQRRGDDI